MTNVPYVPDVEAWKEHFMNFTPSTPKPFYVIKDRQRGDGQIPSVKLVTPTQQVVEQAKAQLKTSKTSYKPKSKQVKRKKTASKKSKKGTKKLLNNARGMRIK